MKVSFPFTSANHRLLLGTGKWEPEDFWVQDEAWSCSSLLPLGGDRFTLSLVTQGLVSPAQTSVSSLSLKFLHLFPMGTDFPHPKLLSNSSKGALQSANAVFGIQWPKTGPRTCYFQEPYEARAEDSQPDLCSRFSISRRATGSRSFHLTYLFLRFPVPQNTIQVSRHSTCQHLPHVSPTMLSGLVTDDDCMSTCIVLPGLDIWGEETGILPGLVSRGAGVRNCSHKITGVVCQTVYANLRLPRSLIPIGPVSLLCPTDIVKRPCALELLATTLPLLVAEGACSADVEGGWQGEVQGSEVRSHGLGWGEGWKRAQGRLRQKSWSGRGRNLSKSSQA